MRCDWEGGPNGPCAGDVQRVVINRHYGDEYYACKRHHNLMLRAWFPKLVKR